MKPLPTDLEILNQIYERYYTTFATHSGPSQKVYVPIDSREVASALAVDPNIVFGRLCYHLGPKFSYRNEDGSRVDFFTRKLEESKDHVHFPYLAPILADLRAEDQKQRTTNWFSIWP